ncbi:MAG: hypothetical protein E7652_01870 [Ruminococcaceae bacterium]|nr:hypothetical protein [Oscillospiraceae bacterium]
MNLYIDKKDSAAAKNVVVDDMILTKDLATTAGSKMLEGYKSLFAAEVVEKLEGAGYTVSGKANVGELAIDLAGESSYFGATEVDGKLTNAASVIVKNEDVSGAVVLEVNGANMRSAAFSDLVLVKPTYGTVSRYGTIPAACSGETVSVMAKTVAQAHELLDTVAGYDCKDGTMHADEKCALIKSGAEFAPIKKVAIAKSLCDTADASKVDAFKAFLEKAGVEVTVVDAEVLTAASAAWSALMCAELCNNVSRYDGVKYGYRTKNYKNIDELYTNSRTEAFGMLLKSAILYGSDALSTSNYDKVYDKGLRVRRVISEYFASLFAEYDAVLIPVASKNEYTMADVEADRYISFKENRFTAPAMITGLPAVVVGGVQLVGKAFSENALLDLAEKYEKEGK